MILEKLRSFKQIKKYKSRILLTQDMLDILVSTEEYQQKPHLYEFWHTHQVLSLQLWSDKEKLKFYKNIKWF